MSVFSQAFIKKHARVKFSHMIGLEGAINCLLPRHGLQDVKTSQCFGAWGGCRGQTQDTGKLRWRTQIFILVRINTKPEKTYIQLALTNPQYTTIKKRKKMGGLCCAGNAIKLLLKTSTSQKANNLDTKRWEAMQWLNLEQSNCQWHIFSYGSSTVVII